MAGFKFKVKLVLQQTTDKSKLTPLRCFVRYNNTRAVFASGIYIEPRYWNQKSQEPRQAILFKDFEKIKDSIKDLSKWIEQAFNQITAKTKEYPEPEALKKLCLMLIKHDGELPGSKPIAKPLNFLEYIELIIADTKSGKRTLKGGKAFSKATPVSYNTTLGVLRSYLKFVKKDTLKFEDIDLDFYNDFKDWCYNTENFTDNYFGKLIKCIKTFMNEGLEAKLHSNASHTGKRFITVQADVENVYLNQDQLDIIANFDFSKNLKAERVRDLFLVGCWTGLRFSDFSNIQPSSIQGDFLEIRTQKTGETVAIPIHPTIKKIMKRYEGKTANSLPPSISNVKLNEYIKEAAKETKQLSVITTLEKARAGKKITVVKPLYELISTHTARRAFASNMFKMGVPTLVIMGVTGHRTEKAFLKYIKVTPKEKAEIMREIWNRNFMKAV
jgi:integrase